jgi:hypothetical protein
MRYVITVYVEGDATVGAPRLVGMVDERSFPRAIGRFAACVAVPRKRLEAGRLELAPAWMREEAGALSPRGKGVWAHDADTLRVRWFCWFGEEIEG